MRAGNSAGWGNWSQPLDLETTGLPVGGECLQDDAPCGIDASGSFVDVTFLYNGLGCEAQLYMRIGSKDFLRIGDSAIRRSRAIQGAGDGLMPSVAWPYPSPPRISSV